MKKGISISLTIFMLAAMLHLSVATHFCSGKIAASKISLSGKLATCGMENKSGDLTSKDIHISSHCCDNLLVYYGITSIYLPSFSFVPESYQNHFQVLTGLIEPDPYYLTINKSIYTNVGPPGVSASSKVDLSTICVFRI
jgi:hypothetical protein